MFLFLEIIQLEDKIIRNIDDEPKKSVQSTQSQMPVTKAYTQPHGTVTDLQTSYSDEHHTPDVSNQTEVKVKDVNSSKVLCTYVRSYKYCITGKTANTYVK